MVVEHAVPVALSPLVGRADERADVARLLDQARLVTLLGPGGTGKTRLAQEVAASSQHPDGASWVDLAGVRDPALVVAAVAAAVGAHERRTQDLAGTLTEPGPVRAGRQPPARSPDRRGEGEHRRLMATEVLAFLGRDR
jgi:hypothetical protein